MAKQIYLLHLLLVFPILFYIGYTGYVKKEKLNKEFSLVVMILSILVFIYHGGSLMKQLVMK